MRGMSGNETNESSRDAGRLAPASLFDLTGRVAVVVGGTGVLCGRMAEGLAAAGAAVVLVGRDGAKARPTIDAVTAAGGSASFIACDATDRQAIEALRDRVLREQGRADILVNGAGVNAATPFLEIPEDELDRLIAVNLKSVFLACQVFGGYFVERAGAEGTGASIINLGSASGLTPLSRVFSYALTKAAVHNLSKNLAREWGALGVRVNVLVPGFLPAEQNRKVLTPERVASILAHTPMGRFGEPDELVGATLLLASDAGRFMTGHELVVDGGFSAMTI
jgi:NAD(P)-dependent dehydrogenase (short-subunit alcohol dehydrogenase family)